MEEELRAWLRAPNHGPPPTVISLAVRWKPSEHVPAYFRCALVPVVTLDAGDDPMATIQTLYRLNSTLCLYITAGLQILPMGIGKLGSLECLGLVECSLLKQLPQDISKLSKLLHLELSRCSSLVQLPASISKLSNLRYLDLTQCSSLQQLPQDIGGLERLTCLDLQACSLLQQLPKDISRLVSLSHLILRGCSSLQELPEDFGKMRNLHHLELHGCSSLQHLPQDIGELGSLQHLDLMECSSLQQLPENLCSLSSLQHLYLGAASSQQPLPSGFSKLSNLWLLSVSEYSLQQLPSVIIELSGLHRLDLDGWSSLQQLPEDFHKLTNLVSLSLRGCSSLRRLPQAFGKLGSLEVLLLTGCSSLQHLPISTMHSLWQIDLEGCTRLARPLRKMWMGRRAVQMLQSVPLDRLPAITRLLVNPEGVGSYLERMSWLGVLLAATTFVAFLQPPGGYEAGALLLGQPACTHPTGSTGTASNGGVCSAVEKPHLLEAFFVLNSLSFGFSMLLVVYVVAYSMPRIATGDELAEAGRTWICLVLASSVLVAAVGCGMAAFTLSGLAVLPASKQHLVLRPMIGMFIAVSFTACILFVRWASIWPGWLVVWRGVKVMLLKREYSPEEAEQSDLLKQVVGELQGGQPAAVHSPLEASTAQQDSRIGESAMQARWRNESGPPKPGSVGMRATDDMSQLRDQSGVTGVSGPHMV